MSNRFDSLIFQTAKSYSVSSALIKAIMRAESAFNPMAKRHEANVKDYSYGLMQVRCDTARWMGYKGNCEELLNPATNINIGTKFLAFLQTRFPNDTERVIAAYNAGPGNAARPFVNQGYVNRVAGFLREYMREAEAEKDRVVTLRPGQPQTGPVPYSPGSPVSGGQVGTLPVRIQAERDGDDYLSVTGEAFVSDEKLPWILAGAGVLAYLLFEQKK